MMKKAASVALAALVICIAAISAALLALSMHFSHLAKVESSIMESSIPLEKPIVLSAWSWSGDSLTLFLTNPLNNTITVKEIHVVTNDKQFNYTNIITIPGCKTIEVSIPCTSKPLAIVLTVLDNRGEVIVKEEIN